MSVMRKCVEELMTVTGVDEELMTVMRDRGGDGVSNEEVCFRVNSISPDL